MGKTCIVTTCSDDSYQYYIPLFVYSAKKAYPNVHVRVYVKGQLKDDVRELLDQMRRGRWLDGKWKVKDGQFKGYPTRSFLHNALRLILPYEQMMKYEHIWVADIDFIILRQKPSHEQYYRSIIKSAGYPIAAFRSSKRRPRRTEVNGNGWAGDYERMACGTVFYETKRWYGRALPYVHQYARIIKKGTHDKVDRHKAGSYREYDEVILARIMKSCGFKIPDRVWYFANGKRFDCKYRDIHLGDFKFERRQRSKSKMRQLLVTNNLVKYCRLMRDGRWQKICEVCSVNHKIRVALRRLQRQVESRCSKSLYAEETAKNISVNA